MFYTKGQKYNRSQFKIHLNAKKHKEWICHLNENRVNYYKTSLEQAETIKNQKIYIAKLELELKLRDERTRIVNNVPTIDLLGIDL